MGGRAKKLAIFDLDGTLVDTIVDVCDCFNQALIECGYPSHSTAFVSSLIGLPLEQIVSSLLPEQTSATEVTRVSLQYKKKYAASDKPNTHPFPGIIDVLEKLQEQGVRLAVNTNKAHEIACDVVNTMFANLDMDIYGYGRIGTTKPSPEAVILLMEQCDALPSETVYIGDTAVDVETAFNAGVDSIVVTWGQGKQSLYDDERAHMVVDDTEQLFRAICG